MKQLFVLLLLMLGTVGLSAMEAEILSISGSVEIKEPGASWQKAQEGQIVSSSSMIATGFNSKASLSVGGMDLTLSPLTRVSIDSLTEETEAVNTSMSLQTGRLRATSQPAERRTRRAINFKVSTPVATAAVRGTDFLLSTNKLVTIEGMVELSRGNQVVLAPAGSQSWSAPETRPTEPIEQVGEVVSPEITAIEEEAVAPAPTQSTGNIGITLK